MWNWENKRDKMKKKRVKKKGHISMWWYVFFLVKRWNCEKKIKKNKKQGGGWKIKKTNKLKEIIFYLYCIWERKKK